MENFKEENTKVSRITQIKKMFSIWTVLFIALQAE